MTTSNPRKHGTAGHADSPQPDAAIPTRHLEPGHYAHFFAHSRDLLCIADLNGKILDLSMPWEALLGYSRAELLGLRLDQLLHPDDIAASSAQLAALNGAGASFEARCRSKDATEHWLNWSVSADTPAELLYLSARTTGTERTRALEALEIYRQISDNMQIGLIIYQVNEPDDETAITVVTANPAAKGFLGGLDLREYSGKRIGEVFPNVFETGAPAAYLEVARSGQSQDLGEVAYSDAKLSGWFTVKAFALPDQCVGITLENVTERKRTMDDLQLYREISDSIPTGMVIYRVNDPDDETAITVVTANPAAKGFLGGLDLREHIGKRIGEVFPKVFETGAPAVYLEVLRSGRSRYLGEIAYDDGNVAGWFAVTVFPLPNGCVGNTFENVTERKRAEQTLRQSLLQEETIRAQQDAMAEMTTPLLTISEHTVVMPLIGAIDSRRAQQVMEALLEGVSTRQAHTAIIDITGVSVVDTQVANALLRAAQAVRLLGANVILTGIRPEVAQTLVGLGVDLAGIVTRATLQNGIAYALQG